MLRLSYVGFNSFVFSQQGLAPEFSPEPAAAVAEDGVMVRVFTSSRLAAGGFESEGAAVLAGHLVRAHREVLPRYVGRRIPVERLDIHLLHASEEMKDRGLSYSLSRRHRLRFVFSFDPDNAHGATRSTVRTSAHELLHVSLSVYGRRNRAGLAEEQAAYAIEHCVELDLFGDTPAPARKAVVHDPGDDAVMTSLTAGHVGDPGLEDAFHGQTAITTEQAGALRDLCRNRVRSLAGYQYPDHP